MQTSRTIPLILAAALFMQNLDTAALATSLPKIAESLDQSLMNIHLLVTAYMLSMAVFLPLSGWVAEKYGARRVFYLSTGIFTFASLMCGLSADFQFLVAMRVLQGFGGALMVPVARLLLVKVVPKQELVGAIALTGIPALLGPIMGPVVGGALSTYFSWRWIFFVNIPVGLVSVYLIYKLLPDFKEELSTTKFDFPGFVLASGGLTLTLLGLERLAVQGQDLPTTLVVLLMGIAMLASYGAYALRARHPILDVRLLRYETFRTSVLGGALFRIGVGAYPFLLPMMLQTVFGFSALKAGAFTCLSALGSLGMRFLSVRLLGRLGYRTTLIWCGTLASVLTMSIAFFTPQMPYLLMGVLLVMGGMSRSVQFTLINTIVFAETSATENSHANTFSQMAQRASLTLAVTLSALILHHNNTLVDGISASAFTAAFLMVGVMMLLSLPLFYMMDPLSTSQIDVADKRKKKAGE